MARRASSLLKACSTLLEQGNEEKRGEMTSHKISTKSRIFAKSNTKSYILSIE